MFLFRREFVTFSCAALLLPVVLVAQTGGPSDETTTHTAQTTNNTAACSAAGYGFESGAFCGDAFVGFWDRSSTSGATVPLTQPHDPPVSGIWNISKGRGTRWGDVHSLLYPGNSTLILAETQFWWWFSKSNYLRWNGRPVLMFFIAENAINFSQCDSNDANGNPIQRHLTGNYMCHGGTACWSSLWDGVRTNFVSHGAKPVFDFREQSE